VAPNILAYFTLTIEMHGLEILQDTFQLDIEYFLDLEDKVEYNNITQIYSFNKNCQTAVTTDKET